MKRLSSVLILLVISLVLLNGCKDNSDSIDAMGRQLSGKEEVLSSGRSSTRTDVDVEFGRDKVIDKGLLGDEDVKLDINALSEQYTLDEESDEDLNNDLDTEQEFSSEYKIDGEQEYDVNDLDDLYAELYEYIDLNGSLRSDIEVPVDQARGEIERIKNDIVQLEDYLNMADAVGEAENFEIYDPVDAGLGLKYVYDTVINDIYINGLQILDGVESEESFNLRIKPDLSTHLTMLKKNLEYVYNCSEIIEDSKNDSLTGIWNDVEVGLYNIQDELLEVDDVDEFCSIKFKVNDKLIDDLESLRNRLELLLGDYSVM